MRREIEKLIATGVADFCFLIEWGMARTESLALLLLGALTLEALIYAAVLLLLGAAP